MRAALFLVVCGACAPPEPWVLSPSDWEDVSEADDPWLDHRPSTVVCPPAARRVERDAFEVESGVCTYLAVRQTREDGRAWKAGGRLRALVWHLGLDAAVPAEAHVALHVDDEMVWETWVPIPDDPRLFEVDVPVAGQAREVQIHLHNHGFNSWNVADVVLDPE